MSSSYPKPFSYMPVEYDPLAGTLPNMTTDPKPESDTRQATNANEVKNLIEALMGEDDGESGAEEGREVSPMPTSPEFGSGPSLIATIDAGPFLKNDSLEGSDVQTPAPETDKNEASSETIARRRGRRRKEKTVLEQAIVPTSPDALDWLPAGWRCEHRVRGSGASAGSKDRYFFDPVSGHRFRSKKEVLSFVETGVKQRRSKANGADAKVSPTVKTSSKKPAKFDFLSRPAKVKWVLEDSAKELWIPYIGERRLSESIKKEWNKTFAHLNSGGVRDGMFQG